MTTDHFSYRFISPKNVNDVFDFLLNPKNWWIGLYGELFDGSSENLGDEFNYKAGDGIHFSNQKLVERTAPHKIGWLVTESNLSFLENTNEWAGTTIQFEIVETASGTEITFTHVGLVPAIECYGACSSAWSLYMQRLKDLLS